MANAKIAPILLILFLTTACTGCGETKTTCSNAMCGSVRVISPDGEILARIGPNAQSTVLHHCEFSELRFEAENPEGEWVEADSEFGGILCPDSVYFFVDNRDHEAVTVQVGSIDFEVPSNQHGTYCFPPSFGQIDVMLDGEHIGEWMGGQTYLLDTTGSRTYCWQEVIYGESRRRAPRDPVVFSSAFLHQVENEFDYFLEAIPDHMDVSFHSETIESMGGYRRRYLTEAE